MEFCSMCETGLYFEWINSVKGGFVVSQPWCHCRRPWAQHSPGIYCYRQWCQTKRWTSFCLHNHVNWRQKQVDFCHQQGYRASGQNWFHTYGTRGENRSTSWHDVTAWAAGIGTCIKVHYSHGLFLIQRAVLRSLPSSAWDRLSTWAGHRC